MFCKVITQSKKFKFLIKRLCNYFTCTLGLSFLTAVTRTFSTLILSMYKVDEVTRNMKKT